MATDVEVSRALNALTTTFEDQKMQRFDSARAQRIVTGALGGEQALTVHSAGGESGWLTDSDGRRRATVYRENGRWVAEREGTYGHGGAMGSAPTGSS